MSDTTEKKFIKHFIVVFKEQVKDIKPISEATSDFEAGKSLAYHEIASLILECSRIFDLQLEDFGIDDVDPDGFL